MFFRLAFLYMCALFMWEATAGRAGVIEYPVKRLARDNMKRTDAHQVISAQALNEQWLYAVEISIGTPPQMTYVEIDTGSSELWVNPNCSSVPADLGQQALCELVPAYQPTLSSTAQGPNGSATIAYGSSGADQTGVKLDYYVDNVTVGGFTVDQRFGVASDSLGLPVGIMGLGPDLYEGFAVNESYLLFLDSLVAQGAIASRAYSLSLGPSNSTEGTLLFGGLDTGKFSGPLTKTPIVPALDNVTRLTIEYSSLSMQTVNGKRDYNLGNDTNVLIDSGNTFTWLDAALTDQIATDLGANYSADLGYYLVDCQARNMSGGMAFGFAKDTATIVVPFSDFIFTAEGLCAVGIAAVEEGGQQVLGLSFIRAAYLIFDWDNEEVHLAQSANCSSSTVPVGTGANAVPSVTGSCEVAVNASTPTNATSTSATPSTTSVFSSSAGGLNNLSWSLLFSCLFLFEFL